MVRRATVYVITLLVIMGCILIPGVVSAASGTSVTITAETASVCPGQIFSVSIDMTADNITAGTIFYIRWDRKLLRAVKVTPGQIYTDLASSRKSTVDYKPGAIDNAAGSIAPSIISVTGGSGGAVGRGRLVTLTMQALTGVSGESNIDVAIGDLQDSHGQRIANTVVNSCRVTIGDSKNACPKPIQNITNPRQTSPFLTPPDFTKKEKPAFVVDLSDNKSPYYDPRWKDAPMPGVLCISETGKPALLTDDIPPHDLWGTGFFNGYFQTYAWMSQQYICNTSYMQDIGDCLYAPTLKGANGCPLEVVTSYEPGQSRLRVYDFYLKETIGNGWTSYSVPLNDSWFRERSVRDNYYIVCIWRNPSNEWGVYIWDFVNSSWTSSVYNQSANVTNSNYLHGWDMFEEYYLDSPFWPRVERIQAKNIIVQTSAGGSWETAYWPYATSYSYITTNWVYDKGFDSSFPYYDRWHVDGSFINNPAQLTNGQVNPTSGTTTSIFTYNVNYNEPEGVAPTVNKHVYIDGVSHVMTSPSNPSNGTYSYSTTLPAGSHNYYFLFDNGSGGTVRQPASGTFSGPIVDSGAVPTAPVITNSAGASLITASTARLNGEVTSTGGQSPTVHVYWGAVDGGTTAGNWAHDVNLSTLGVGTFYTDISGLSASTNYFYRCYAQNSSGSSWAASSASFVASGAAVQIIGSADATTGTSGPGYAIWDRWPALSTGNVTQFRVKCTGPGNVKVAIFADNAGNPGILLNAVNTGTPVVAGWNTITIPPTAVTAGTNYWLAFIPDVACVAYQSGGSNLRQYIAATYSTFTFASSPVNLLSITGYYNGLAGWSTPMGSSAPTVTNASGATNITGTTATLNGNLTSDGGSATSVTVYWGINDGGTSPTGWTYNVQLGTRSVGTFSTNIGGLTNGTTYYYRCYASNSAGSDWADSSVSFVASGAAVQIIGPADATTGTSGPGYAIWDRWPALSTGNVTQFRVKCTGPGNVKVAIFADNAGNPGILLNAVNTGTPVVAGWNTITIPPTAVTAGTNYWLAFIPDVACVAYQSGGSNLRQYIAAPYSTFTFTSNPVNLLSITGYYNGLAGWSTPLGPSAPTVTNSSGATNITGTTATLNGNLTSDGGAATSVTVYWGPTDGGATFYWGNSASLGTMPIGAFSTNISGLTPGTTYYYRCYASNSAGSDWADSSVSFVATGAAVQIIGPADATTGTSGPGYAIWDRWPALSSGNITQFRVKCTGAGNVKVAIFADNAGSPGILLNAVNTGTPVVAGWNTIIIPSTAITAGTNYWLAFIPDVACVAYQTGGSNLRQYISAPYSTFTFTSNPVNLLSITGYYNGLAGWSTPLGPSAPTVTNSSGATNITGTTATLNGNLTSDGGAATSVTVYWGPTDGGATFYWGNSASLGTMPIGAFSTNISGLTPGTTYYYRFYASNSAGSDWADSSASFVATGATVQIIGPADATTGASGPGFAIWDRWPALSSGNVTQFRVKCTGPGNVKVAIFADNAGNPGILLNAVNTGTPVVAGWNTITIPSTAITAGTNYWLAFIPDVACVAYQTGGSNLRQYISAIYSTFTFVSSPVNLLSTTGYYNGLAGWSTPLGPSAPTVTNSSGATNITGTTATLNGNLTSDGGSATNVIIYWGPADGGTNSINWLNNIALGTMPVGPFSFNLTSLTPGTTYYYRCYASNSAGSSWASGSTSFTTTGGGQLTRYEYYNMGDDDVSNIYNQYWFAQSFTPTNTHTIKSVKLKLFRWGDPGYTLTIGIRATDASGKPTGGDLCSGTYPGGSITLIQPGDWYEIPLGNGCILSAGTKYVIAARYSGTYTNQIGWRLNYYDSVYNSGELILSSDSGITWLTYTSVIDDLMFEEWGVP